MHDAIPYTLARYAVLALPHQLLLMAAPAVTVAMRTSEEVVHAFQPPAQYLTITVPNGFARDAYELARMQCKYCF